jgi:oligoribonuclease NrnB/cAMP/cGMP phosphodiesterase (DHH superfamily)
LSSVGIARKTKSVNGGSNIGTIVKRLIPSNVIKHWKMILLLFKKNGVAEFEKEQKYKEHLLKEMLQEFNDGRSKSYYCIAATVLDIKELKEAITIAKKRASGLDIKEKSKVLHTILDDIAQTKNYFLKLRK